MTVVVVHLVFAFHGHFITSWYGLLFLTGPQAVLLFFVLSGYVLSLPTWSGKTVSYPRYALSRLARIYLPFFAAAVLSIGAAFTFRNRPLYLNPWFDQTWHVPVSAANVLAQLLMWPTPIFNTALWSLRYEMQVSLLLPFLLWAATRTNVLVLTGAWMMLVYGHLGFMGLVFGWHVWNETLGVAGLFLLGASAARYHHTIETTLRQSASSRWILFTVSLCVYVSTFTVSLVSTAWLPVAAASLGLILIAVSSRRAAALLSSPLCTYLGHISYSLYLTHSIVLFGLTYLLYFHVRVRYIILAIVTASFLLADLFHRWIEVPSIHLSRLLKSGKASAFHSTKKESTAVTNG